MTLPPISPALPAGTPADAAGRPTGAEGAGFPDALAHQQAQVRERGVAHRPASGHHGSDTVPRSSSRPDEDGNEAATPELTLAMLAAGAALPLMGGALPAGQAPAAGIAADAEPPSRLAGRFAAGDIRLPGTTAGALRTASPLPTDGSMPGPAGLVATPVDAAAAADPAAPATAPHPSVQTQAMQAALRHAVAEALGRWAPREGAEQGPAAPPLAGQLMTGTDAAAAPADGRALAGLAAWGASAGAAHGGPLAASVPDAAAFPSLQAGLAGPLGGAPASTAGDSLQIATPLAHAQWASDFSQQFMRLTQHGGGLQTANLHLNPPELGPVRIVLQLHEAAVQALFVSPHAPVRQAIENALPQLQQQMADAGLSLGQAGVSDQGAGQHAFGQAPGQAGQQASAPRFSLDGDPATVPAAALPEPATGRPTRAPDALVDTFA